MSVAVLNKPDLEVVATLGVFNGAIGFYATTLGIAAPALLDIQNDCNYLIFEMGTYKPAMKAFNLQNTAYDENTKFATGNATVLLALPPVPVFGTPPTAVLPGALDRMSVIIQTIKLNKNYTEQIGLALGIIPTKTPKVLTAPEVKNVDNTAGHVVFEYVKNGYPGLMVQYRIAGTTPWIDLPTMTTQPYIDLTPLPVPGVAVRKEFRFAHAGPTITTPVWTDIMPFWINPPA